MANYRLRIGQMRTIFDTFDDSEDPLGTPWQARVNANLTDMYASGGKALGKAAGNGEYDDSAALLSGFTANVDIVATVFKNASINTGANHELELLLRATQDADQSFQYECLFNSQGGTQCFAWEDGGGGTQAFRELTASSGSINLGRAFVTGDRLHAKIVGTTITMSCIDASDVETILGVFSDSAYSTGQPGIGAFYRVGDGANQAHWCFQDVRVTQLS